MLNKKFKYIYGPVSSWRLGRSLGVDLLSQKKKMCTFDCAYCQISAEPQITVERKEYVPTAAILEEIKALPDGMALDHITFSGKGEPALASNLGEAIKAVRRVKKEKIAVITNSSMMCDESARRDLSLADVVVAKIDAASQPRFERVNRPARGITFKGIYDGIKEFRKHYKGKLAVQIMFSGFNKNDFKELAALAYGIKPYEIQINTATRRSPVKPLSKRELAKITEYFRAAGAAAGSKTRVISAYDAAPKGAEAINKKATAERRGKKMPAPRE